MDLRLRVRLSGVHGSSLVANGLSSPAFTTLLHRDACKLSFKKVLVLQMSWHGHHAASKPRVVAIESWIGIGATSGPHAVVSVRTVLRS